MTGFEEVARTDRGSIAPLVAGYLALILLTIFGSAAVGVSMIAINRVQAVTDAAVLFAHDRSVTRGIPSVAALGIHAQQFLASAPSAKRIEVSSLRIRVSGAITELELCAKVSNPLMLREIDVCRLSKAESFIVR
jgi:hypothetical protein